MHIEYKVSQAGVGLYIFINIETQTISNKLANKSNNAAIQINFPDAIPDVLKAGVEYMQSTLEKHSHVVPNDGNSYILNVTAIEKSCTLPSRIIYWCHDNMAQQFLFSSD